MNERDIQLLSRKFPLSQATIRRNQAGGEASSPKPEQVVCNEPMAEKKGEVGNPACCIVRIKSFRRRLLDRDNLTGGAKYFIDSLRYSKLIHDDTEASITLEVSQVKVKTKNEERTEITIEKI